MRWNLKDSSLQIQAFSLFHLANKRLLKNEQFVNYVTIEHQARLTPNEEVEEKLIKKTNISQPQQLKQLLFKKTGEQGSIRSKLVYISRNAAIYLSYI